MWPLLMIFTLFLFKSIFRVKKCIIINMLIHLRMIIHIPSPRMFTFSRGAKLLRGNFKVNLHIHCIWFDIVTWFGVQKSQTPFFAPAFLRWLAINSFSSRKFPYNNMVKIFVKNVILFKISEFFMRKSTISREWAFQIPHFFHTWIAINSFQVANLPGIWSKCSSKLSFYFKI